jgi:hypothetical protein
MNYEKLVIILPVCVFPTGEEPYSRLHQLVENIRHIQKYFPVSKIVVVDNGKIAPELSDVIGVELLYFPHLSTNQPSLGEATMLLHALNTIESNSMVLKLHARCRLTNIEQLKSYIESHGEFLLLCRNLFNSMAQGTDKLPYIDTRVLYLRHELLIRVLSDAIDRLTQYSVFNLEQAMLPCVYSDSFNNIVVTKGKFFPKLSGQAGHGRDYNSFLSRIRAYMKCCLYRVGI